MGTCLLRQLLIVVMKPTRQIYIYRLLGRMEASSIIELCRIFLGVLSD